jgi:spore maturation protein CgeB
MRVVLFCHSLYSDWNHGNAHFLRGIVTELAMRGHRVSVHEPVDAWSVQNLVRDHGEEALEWTMEAYPAIRPHRYDPATLDLDKALEGAELVLVHEWNEPELVRRLGTARTKPGSRFRLLFHDTHHRCVTDPESMARFDLSGYDGVLAFGEAVRDVYGRRGWGRRVWVWHEAADVRVFRPSPLTVSQRGDVVWIGNWGDEERATELRELLLEPVTDLGLVAMVHGVRYPADALAELSRRGIRYGGWLPNFRVPAIFAKYTMTIHVPRRPYVHALPGIPTIRMFEALACEVPLISGRWDDVEELFLPGRDFLVANNADEMRGHMRTLLGDGEARRELARNGRQTILDRHTCAHRVDELCEIAHGLGIREHMNATRPEGLTL